MTLRLPDLTVADGAGSLDDARAANDPEAIRYFLLGAKGEARIEGERKGERWAFAALDEAERRVQHLYDARARLVVAAGRAEPALGNVLQGQAHVVDRAPPRVGAALEDDDPAAALAVLGELVRAIDEIVAHVPKLAKKKPAQDAARALAAYAVNALDGSCALLGLMQVDGVTFARRTRDRRVRARGLDVRAIEARVRARVDARRDKDFARADALRKELDAMGVEVHDDGESSTWRVAL